MRNIFDQYSQPENKLTHALACTLEADRSLIRPFLNWCGVPSVPPVQSISITEQQVPGVRLSTDDETESSGLPDMSLFTEDGWAVLFEMKINAKLTAGQLNRHLQTAKRHGYDNTQVVSVVVDKPPALVSTIGPVIYWRDIYSWFSRHRLRSSFANQFIEYMSIFESRLIQDGIGPRGTITMFDGINFNDEHPYSYREAKRIIRLLGDELQTVLRLHELGVDPQGQRRSAITGRGTDAVWDFLPLVQARGAKQFTSHPHLTMNIAKQGAHAAITVPNGIKGGFKSRLKDLGRDGFIDLLTRIEQRTRKVIKRSAGSAPFIYVLQRHYNSQRSPATKDAALRADLRTLIQGGSSRVRYQPQWHEAVYELIVGKRSNMQLGVEIDFKYGCQLLGSTAAVGLFADAWIALHPLLEFALGDEAG